MEAFKNYLVGKSCNLKEEIEKLPGELRKLWIDREFKSFLEKFQDISTRRKKVISTKVLPFLPELGRSFDNEVHKRILACYKDLSKLWKDQERLSGELPRMVASSSNKYLVNILCRERKIFCTNDVMEQHLKFVSRLWEEQTLKVEEELRREFQTQSDSSVPDFFGHKYVLQQIALNFMGKLYIYPLFGSEFPKHPGVYFIYDVGKTQLYEGSPVFPSTRHPVYVGMSTKNIAKRLEGHRKNIKDLIEKASGDEQTEAAEQSDGKQTEGEEQSEEKEQSDEEQTEGEEQSDGEQRDDEQTKEKQTEEEKTEKGTQTGVKREETDFFFRFMIVDPGHYACSIESMLIEYFCPVWNSETVKLSFGNASGGKTRNTWYKYHILEDPGTMADVLGRLKISP